MKLSEIISAPPTDKIIFGIEVDCECLHAPADVEQAGFLYQGGKDGLSNNLMDAIISYGLAGISVIVEVEYDADVNAKNLMMLAANAGFSISLIPPQNEDNVEKWGELCARFANEFLATPNFFSHIYPVQGYFTYLISEKLGALTALTPSDEYVLARFTNATPESWSDSAKLAMRQGFLAACGGEEGLERLASTLVSAIGYETDKILSDDARANPNA